MTAQINFSTDVAQMYTHPNDDFVQAGELYREVMTNKDRDHLIDNIVNHLAGARKRIQFRQTALFYKADQEYGRRVAEGLKLQINIVEQLASMSQEERAIFTADDAQLNKSKKMLYR